MSGKRVILSAIKSRMSSLRPCRVSLCRVTGSFVLVSSKFRTTRTTFYLENIQNVKRPNKTKLTKIKINVLHIGA